jgi:cell division protein FtsQ
MSLPPTSFHRATSHGIVALPPSRRRRKRRPRPLGRKLGLSVFAVLALGLALSLLAGGRSTGGLLALPGADKLLAWSGLSVDQISVRGHQHTPDADIFAAVDAADARSLLSFDSAEARERVERLPWVAAATISRVLPGSLEVRIRERTPAAVWNRGDRDYLIDADGRVLAVAEPGMSTTLPHVAGEGAATQVRSLIDLIKHYPPIAERYESAERVGERRWTLHLKGGVTVHLAPDREAASFSRLSAPDDLGKLLTVQNVIIDLRTPERITLRPAPERSDASDVSNPPSQARS